jgi:hypothetical protein
MKGLMLDKLDYCLTDKRQIITTMLINNTRSSNEKWIEL